MNPESKHGAVIFIYAEIHPLLESGEFSGNCIYRLPQDRGWIPLKIEGETRDQCIMKLNSFIDQVRKLCQ